MISRLWNKAEDNLRMKEDEKLRIKDNIDDYLENNKDADVIIAKKLVNKPIPGLFDFVKTKKSTYDFGNLSLKCVYESTWKHNKKISYLSILSEYRERLEATFGLSSKGIKVNGLKILIDKSSMGGADRYVIYKYCPSLENISHTGQADILPKKVNANEKPVEYADLLFTTMSIYDVNLPGGGSNEFHYLNKKTFNEIGDGDKFYVNFDNPYNSKIDRLALKPNTTEISSTSLNDIYSNQLITLNLSHTDNDISILFFKGSSMEQVKVDCKIKVIFNVDISKEDFVQNFNDMNKINDVVLKNLLIVNSSKKIEELYKFALIVKKDNLANVFKSALDVYDDNKFIIKVYNKFKPIYKTLLSMSTYGVSKANLFKLINFIIKGPMRLPKKEYITNPSGIYAEITKGIIFPELLKLSNSLNNTKYISNFIFEFLKVANYSFDIGNERTISYSVVTNLYYTTDDIYDLEKYGEMPIASKQAIIKKQVEQIPPDEKTLYYDIEEKQYKNENIVEDIDLLVKQNIREAEEMEKAMNIQLNNWQKEIEEKNKQIADLKAKTLSDEQELSALYAQYKPQIDNAQILKSQMLPRLEALEKEKENIEVASKQGLAVDAVYYGRVVEEYNALKKEYDAKLGEYNTYEEKAVKTLKNKEIVNKEEAEIKDVITKLQERVNKEKEKISKKKKEARPEAIKEALKGKKIKKIQEAIPEIKKGGGLLAPNLGEKKL